MKKHFFELSLCCKRLLPGNNLKKRQPKKPFNLESQNSDQLQMPRQATDDLNRQKNLKMDSNKTLNTKPLNIEHLVVLLISNEEPIQTDELFRFSFFLSSRVFVSPHDLLIILFEQTIQSILEEPNAGHQTINLRLTRFMILLKEWADNFPNDFRKKKTWTAFYLIREKCIAINNDLASSFDELASFLTNNNKDLNKYEDYLLSIHSEIIMKGDLQGDNKITERSIIDVCPDFKMLADQLTHIELDRLSHIGPEEYIDYTFAIDVLSQVSNKRKKLDEININRFESSNKSPNELKAEVYNYIDSCDANNIYINKSNQRKYLQTSSNLKAYELWTNRLYSFVSSEIVKITTNKRKRIELIEYFIACADQCFKLGNFNSGYQIIKSLEISPNVNPKRLVKTFSKIKEESWKKMTILASNTSENSNYMTYRSILKNLGTKTPVKIPILTIFLQDIYYSIENNIKKDISSKGLSFKGFWNVAKYIVENMNCKNEPFNKPVNNQVINYLLSDPILTDAAQEYSSYLIEPDPERVSNLENLKEKFFKDLNSVGRRF